MIKLSCFFKIIFLVFLFSCKFDRTPVQAPQYTVPFPISTPQTQNLDENILNELSTKINEGEFNQIHSFLIVRNNVLVFEEYFRGFNRSNLHDCYSVTKSITSTLIGIAIQQEYISNTNEKILEFFPEYSNINNLDSTKENISLENLLTMTAGFAWIELALGYNDPNNDIFKMSRSNDWVKYVLDKPMAKAPGTQFFYNSGCTILLSGIIKNKTGLSAEFFCKQYLFTPLNISTWEWEFGPNNISNTGWGLQLRPLDLAVFGSLYLNNGFWNGVQIVDSSWINLSTQSHVPISVSYEYGYQWWRFTNNSSVGNALIINDIYFAFGYGGQFIFIIPHLNMVIVSTAENFSNSTIAFGMLRDYILPAILPE
jgi:CubicO group peptidase (beta-lactamase class C family)